MKNMKEMNKMKEEYESITKSVLESIIADQLDRSLRDQDRRFYHRLLRKLRKEIDEY